MKQEKNTFIKSVIEKHGTDKSKVIPILQDIQNEYNYLPTNVMEQVCELTDITPMQLNGVSTFYTQFRHVPAGKHMIKVCVGTACHVKGAMQVFDAIKRHLNLDKNEDTDKEGLFTIEEVACLGCCTLAPVVQIDNVTYGKVAQGNIAEIIEDFLSKKEDLDTKNKSFTKSLVPEAEIRLGLGSCCVASGSDKILHSVEDTVHKSGIQVSIKHVGCVGMCHNVPLVEIVKNEQEPILYAKVQPDEIKEIINKHFKPKSPIKKLSNYLGSFFDKMYLRKDESPLSSRYLDVKEERVDNFLNKQIYIATEAKGVINPSDLEEYKSNGGFLGLKKCLSSSSEETINAIKKSGLKGRGGAGFPTWKKWDLVAKEISDNKTIICNGDEGDPGAFMDRMLLESFPYRIIEGMIIAAYAVQAHQGYLYIRAEYPLAVERIKDGIKQCKSRGLLGENILNSGFSFDLHVFQGAGAFVCGEETALIASMEGERGMPRIRPPYPSESGFQQKPTLVNNAETFSNVSWILRNGADKYNKIGTENSKGTKVFALAGKIERGGLIEVPMGITINDIVNEIGGGIQNNKKFKAVQIGGPSGGCIPAALGHTPVDFQHLNKIGAMMGSGGLVVLDEDDCAVDIAKYFLSFTQDQSCGKCVFCRVGTKKMLDILQNITSGKGNLSDLDELKTLSYQIKEGSLCGLGKTAPNPVLTSLHYFKDEYLAHIEGKCPAKKCTDLITYEINDDCIGCTKCAMDCPVEAIEFNPYEKHTIDNEKCIKCDVCKQICPVDAVIKY